MARVIAFEKKSALLLIKQRSFLFYDVDGRL